jgi:hypothetical protein
MSEDVLKPGVYALPDPIQPMDTPDPEATDAEKATQLPDPTGWKLLCAVPDVVDTFENSSLLKPTSFMKQEETATTVLFVLKVGPEAYKDANKFPTGAWCKAGDFVLVDRKSVV